MLKALTIRDLAIVRELDVEFGTGLTVITGETGAGKSILVDALGLTLGDRTDAGSVRPGAARATVTATFDLSQRSDLASRLAAHDIEATGECVLRRVVGSDGRSRAYCNETPVAVQFLKEFGAWLVGIHGQHANHALLERPAQRDLLDAYGNLGEPVDAVRRAHRALGDAEAALQSLRGGYKDAASRLDFLRFQQEELAGLPLETDALRTLEAEHRKAANAERLEAGCADLAHRLFDEQRGAQRALRQAAQTAQDLAHLDPALSPVAEMIQQAAINLDETEHELDRYNARLGREGARLAELDARLAEIHAAARKHRCEPAELLEVRERLETEIHALVHHEVLEREAAEAVRAAAQAFDARAVALTAARAAAAVTLDDAVTGLLHELALPHARFRTAIARAATPGDFGVDELEFLISANPDQEPRPLRKVASGGELSRLSLAIQVATAGVSGVPVLVYDEVDSGVSGRVAAVLARLLRGLAGGRQILCVTHMPQVAAAGDQHLLIGKSVVDGVTRSNIEALGRDGRVRELARMLSGEEVTARSLAHARELLRA